MANEETTGLAAHARFGLPGTPDCNHLHYFFLGADLLSPISAHLFTWAGVARSTGIGRNHPIMDSRRSCRPHRGTQLRLPALVLLPPQGRLAVTYCLSAETFQTGRRNRGVSSWRRMAGPVLCSRAQLAKPSSFFVRHAKRAAERHSRL